MSAYSAEIRTRWLGSVPPDWNLAPAWAVFHERSEKSCPTHERLTPSQHYGVLTQLEYMELTGSRVVVNKSDSVVAKRVLANDFIIHLRSFQGGIEHSRVSGKVTNAYTVLSPVDGVDPEYYRHFLKSDPFISGLSSMTDQLRDGQSINFGKFSTMRLPLPPLPTQRAIADYLNRETAQIDAMTAELDALTDTLEYRRKSAIDLAIRENGGSGRLIFAIETSQTGPFGTQLLSSEYVEGGIPLINPSHISRGGITPEDGVSVSREKASHLSRFALMKGDVILGRKGDVTKSAKVSDYDLPAICGSDSIFLRPKESILCPDFLWWWFQSSDCHTHLEMYSVGSTMPGLNQRIIQSIEMPIPSLDEQHRIVEHLDEVTAEIDSMIADALELKALLAERRSALITEVVTGRKEVLVS